MKFHKNVAILSDGKLDMTRSHMRTFAQIAQLQKPYIDAAIVRISVVASSFKASTSQSFEEINGLSIEKFDGADFHI